jgi:protein-S-isoprenylcysteine O-methyltransferase Ste14
MARMPGYAYAILTVGWLVWVLPFFLVNRQKQPAKQVDKRARWGIVLVCIAYSLLWQGHFWERAPHPWQTVVCIFFFVCAALLSWTGARALGRQWRMDAGLTADHQLVMAGPYRVVRHPIYASMLCVLLATGFLVTPWWLFLPAFAILIAGTEIRVRVEDKLLASQFGEQATEYQRRVSAYIPLLR